MVTQLHSDMGCMPHQPSAIQPSASTSSNGHPQLRAAVQVPHSPLTMDFLLTSNPHLPASSGPLPLAPPPSPRTRRRFPPARQLPSGTAGPGRGAPQPFPPSPSPSPSLHRAPALRTSPCSPPDPPQQLHALPALNAPGRHAAFGIRAVETNCRLRTAPAPLPPLPPCGTAAPRPYLQSWADPLPAVGLKWRPERVEAGLDDGEPTPSGRVMARSGRTILRGGVEIRDHRLTPAP